jgi:hypothetical protein
MATNPYEGTQGYDRAWHDGFVAGNHDRQNTSPTPPSAFPPWELDQENLGYFQQVWGEGHLAGREAPEEGMQANVEHQEQHLAHVPASDVIHGFEALSLAKSVVKGHWGVAAVEVFLMVMIPSGAPRWTEEEGDLHIWFGGVCQNHGFGEIFMPVIWGESDESPGWHGSAYTEWEGAKEEANKKFAEDPSVVIAHFRCDSPGIMEILHPTAASQ